MAHKCTACERVFADGSEEILSGCPDCNGNTFQYLRSHPDHGEESTPSGPVAHVATTLKDFISDGGQPLPEDEAPEDEGEVSGGVDPDRVDADGADEKPITDTDGTDRKPNSGDDEPDAENRGNDELEAAFVREESDEHHAQSSARTDLASRDELPDDVADLVRTDPGGDGRIIDGELVTGGSLTGGDESDESVPEESTPDESLAEESASDELAPSVDSPADASVDDQDAGEIDADSTVEAGADSTVETDADPTVEADADSTVETDPEIVGPELSKQFEGIRVEQPGRYQLNPEALIEREETIIALKEDGRYVIDVPDSWLGA